MPTDRFIATLRAIRQTFHTLPQEHEVEWGIILSDRHGRFVGIRWDGSSISNTAVWN